MRFWRTLPRFVCSCFESEQAPVGDVESRENLPEEGERVGRREEGGGRRESGPPCGLQQTTCANATCQQGIAHSS